MKRFVLVILAAIVGMAAKAQQWEMDYGDPNSYTVFGPGVVNSNGDAVLVGASGTDKNHYYPAIVSVTADGECTSRVFDTIEGNVRLSHIVQFENGNYLASALVRPDVFGWAEGVVFLVLDPDFNLVALKSYETPEMVLSMSGGKLMLDDDGTVVYSGGYEYQTEFGIRIKPCFYRFDEKGDTLSCRFVEATMPHPEAFIDQYECYQLLKNPSDEGFLVLGCGINGGCTLLKYDYDFNYAGSFMVEIDIWTSFRTVYSDLWLPDHRLLVMGYMHSQGEYSKWHIAMAEFGLDGTLGRWERVYHKQDTAIQAPTRCMAYVNDSTIYGGATFYKYLGGEDYASVSLYSTDMEVLGRKEFVGQEYGTLSGCSFVMPMSDGGCLIGTLVGTYYLGDYSHGKLIKMRREDFNPIPWSVKEVPQETIKALAYPNPAKDELHIDICGLLENKEHRIRITDALGHIWMDRIIHGQGNLLTVGVSSLKPGVYVYTIYNTENEIVRNKFVIEQ